MLIDKAETKRKNILFCVLFILSFLVSATITPGLNNVGMKVVPDITLALCVVSALMLDKKTACIYALIFGTLTDLFVMPAFHFSPVIYFIVSYFAVRLLFVFSRMNASTVAVISIPFLLIRSLVGIFYLLYSYKAPLGKIISKCIAPEFFVNLASVIVTYYVCILIMRFLRIRKQR